MSYKLNPFTGKLDNVGTQSTQIVEYLNADKPSAVAGDVWVKHTQDNQGQAMGLLLALTYTGSGIEKYELSWKSSVSTILRVELT